MADGMKTKLFESWCQRRRDKHTMGGEPNEHESAGLIYYGHGIRFLLVRPGDTDDIELHLCKHCGCVYGVIKEKK